MNPAEFDNYAACEGNFWWCVGMQTIFLNELERAARNRGYRHGLDVGCGTGAAALSVARKFGWSMTLADLSERALAHSQRRGFRQLTQTSILALPFRDASFDAVFCLDVLAHLCPGEELKALEEVARVTRHGGMVVVRASALSVLRSRHSMFVGERQRFTRGSLERIAAAAGWRRIRSTYLNSLLLPVALLKFRVWEPLAARCPASGLRPLPVWLNALLARVLKLEAMWLSRGREFPIGQSVLYIGERL